MVNKSTGHFTEKRVTLTKALHFHFFEKTHLSQNFIIELLYNVKRILLFHPTEDTA